MDGAEFKEVMFMLVHRAGFKPVVWNGKNIVMFSSKEAVERFTETVGLPEGVAISRESGWHRIVWYLQSALQAGAVAVAVDPEGQASTGGFIAQVIPQLESMMRETGAAPGVRLARVLCQIKAHQTGAPAGVDASSAAGLVEVAEKAAAEWSAPAHILKLLPLIAEFLRSVTHGAELIEWGGKDGQLLVPAELDEFSIWAEEELEKRAN